MGRMFGLPILKVAEAQKYVFLQRHKDVSRRALVAAGPSHRRRIALDGTFTDWAMAWIAYEAHPE